jgi:hypothetical protein
MNEIKKYSESVRIIKLFKAYGNFIMNAAKNKKNLCTFNAINIDPLYIVDMHACWDETPQDGNYWYYIHNKVKNFDVCLFKDKKVLDSCLNVLENKTYDVDIQW